MRWIAALLTTTLLAGPAMAANATNYVSSPFQEQQNHLTRSQLDETRKQSEVLSAMQAKQDAQIQALQQIQQQQTTQIQLMQQQIRLQQQLIQLLQSRTQTRGTNPATRR